MNSNQTLNSMIDSMMTPWKPIGPVDLGKARRQVRRIPGTGPANNVNENCLTTPWCTSPYRGHGVESWSHDRDHGVDVPAVRVSL